MGAGLASEKEVGPVVEDQLQPGLARRSVQYPSSRPTTRIRPDPHASPPAPVRAATSLAASHQAPARNSNLAHRGALPSPPATPLPGRRAPRRLPLRLPRSATLPSPEPGLDRGPRALQPGLPRHSVKYPSSTRQVGRPPESDPIRAPGPQPGRVPSCPGPELEPRPPRRAPQPPGDATSGPSGTPPPSATASATSHVALPRTGSRPRGPRALQPGLPRHSVKYPSSTRQVGRPPESDPIRASGPQRRSAPPPAWPHPLMPRPGTQTSPT